YETMAATARRQPEGSLVYVIEQTDLYLRVRDGVRQVLQLVVWKVLSVGIVNVLHCPQLHLVALNSPQTGAMRGIRGADFMCFTQAQAIGMKGTFRAFLSARLQDLHSIVRKADRDSMPIVNLKLKYQLYWDAIFNDGRMKDRVPIYSFDGRDVLSDSAWPEKTMWHGSTSGGQRHVDSFCETWRVGERALTGMPRLCCLGQISA
uniref:Collagenase NC10/endostatin domain-containing protein n=1 Tax=Stegastes partitus TaxID=144197 RepID=A0A3B5A6L9_9TELE